MIAEPSSRWVSAEGAEFVRAISMRLYPIFEGHGFEAGTYQPPSVRLKARLSKNPRSRNCPLPSFDSSPTSKAFMAKKGPQSELSQEMVAGLFRDPFTATDLVRTLTAVGFSKEDIAVAVARPSDAASNDAEWTRPVTKMFSDSPMHDGVGGSLRRLGVEPARAEYFERGVRSGYILITVHARQRAPEAASMMRCFGADLGERGQVFLLDDRELKRVGDQRIEVFGGFARERDEKKAA
jgi:hypothetical protein